MPAKATETNASLSLAQINNDIRELTEILGDLDTYDPEAQTFVEEELRKRIAQRGIKVDAVVYFLKSLEQRAAFQQEMADLHAKAAKQLGNAIQRTKDYFVYLYESEQIEKSIKGVSAEIRFQSNSQLSVSYTVDDSQEYLKQLYLSGTADDLVEQEVRFSYKLKKDGLKQRMEEGRVPSGIIARIGSHMRTKIG